MNEILKKQIIDDLEKTGFPLEVFVASELEDNDWMVDNSPLYRDEEEGQSRELDIHALKVYFYNARHISRKVKGGNENKLVSHLIIQCKKSEKPWVFFDNGSMRWPQIPSESFKSEFEDFHDMEFDELESFGLKNYRLKGAILHKSYHEAFSDPKHTSKIYEPLITLIKALKFLKKRYSARGYTLQSFNPIIVLDGTLWSATLKKATTAPNIILKEVHNLFVVFNQLSQSEGADLELEEEYVIQIITRNTFKKYISEIENDNQELYNCWTNYSNAQK